MNRRLELGLGKPLQHAICGTHLHELPLRHVFHNADGGTSGPGGFKGPIRKEIEHDLTKRPVVQYAAVCGLIEGILEDIFDNMNQDHKYLYRMCRAVQSGPSSFPAALAQIKPVLFIMLDG